MISSDPQPLSDEALAEKCQTGCGESFEMLVSRFEGRIHHFLLRFTGNAHDAQDLTQVAFVKAWRNIDSYKPTGAFSTWLFTIAKRSALNHFRSLRPAEPLDETTPGAPVERRDPSDALSQKDESSVLWETARRLKPDQHEALWLRYGEGFSIEESARIMGTNQIRVRVLLHRARGNLAKLLGGPDHG